MAANTILDNMKRSTKMFTDGFVKWDVDLMLAPRSEDCMYTVRPKSMGFPPADNQAFRQFVEGTLMKVLQDTKFVVNDEVFDAEARKAVVTANTTANSLLGPYEMEYVMMLFFDENGEKIVRIVEYVDSAYGKDFWGRMAALGASQSEGKLWTMLLLSSLSLSHGGRISYTALWPFQLGIMVEDSQGL